MRAAFLLAAHSQPEHLALLVDSLACDWARVFIHIDAKADIREFHKRIPESERVVFLEGGRRVKVHWSGFSQVQATLNLLEASQDHADRFDRFCLLSGSDFPIKPMERIRAALDSQTEFMRVDRRLDARDDNAHCRYVRHRHFHDLPFRSLTSLITRFPRKTYDGISLYHGSGWWSLTHGAVAHVRDFIQRNPDYLSFHRHSLCPDEIFFHSIIKSSPFASRLSHDFERIDGHDRLPPNEHGCHYVSWTAKGGRLPKTLTEEDADELLRSGALFARKFHGIQSAGLLRILARSIRAGPARTCYTGGEPG